MIVYDTRSFLRVIFSWKGTVFPQVAFEVAFATVISVLLVLLKHFDVIDLGINIQAHSVISVLLGLSLTFRTNTCNQRYNEGRTLLGGVNNTARSFIRTVCAHIDPDDEIGFLLKNDIRRYLSALFISYRQSVRLQHKPEEYRDVLLDSEIRQLDSFKQRPQLLSMWISNALQRAVKLGRLEKELFYHLERQMQTLTDCWGGMQRIASTPTPFAYVRLFVCIVRTRTDHTAADTRITSSCS